MQDHAGRIELTMDMSDRFGGFNNAAHVEFRSSPDEVEAHETRAIC